MTEGVKALLVVILLLLLYLCAAQTLELLVDVGACDPATWRCF